VTTLSILQSVCQAAFLADVMNFDRKRQKIPFEIIILTDKRAETGRNLFGEVVGTYITAYDLLPTAYY